MDFTLEEPEQAVADLAAELLGREVTTERLAAGEKADAAGHDVALWAALAEAGLLGVTVPEKFGGIGLGPVALGAFLEEVGRTAAPVPALATLAYAVPALVTGGTAAQQEEFLPGVTDGSVVLSAALVEPLGDPNVPATTAVQVADGWELTGLKTCVPSGMYADCILVSAMTSTGGALFLLDPAATGVTRTRQDTPSLVSEAQLELHDVRVTPDALVGDTTGQLLAATVELAAAASCAVMAGVADKAVRLTADYVRTREQFGQPLAAFQAVRQRLADAYIDTTAVRLTALEALWRLEHGLPAAREVAVAKLYAAEAGRRVVRAAAHLHGGIGVDREYPLHRYYAVAKQLELSLGGAPRQLATLGQLLAADAIAQVSP
jgi:alkylation response protein AidB-like acyl-CoA dehydrogenase